MNGLDTCSSAVLNWEACWTWSFKRVVSFFSLHHNTNFIWSGSALHNIILILPNKKNRHKINRITKDYIINMLPSGRKIHCNIRLCSVAQLRNRSRCFKTQTPKYNTKLPLYTWKGLSNRLNFYSIKDWKYTQVLMFLCLCRTPRVCSFTTPIVIEGKYKRLGFENSNNQIPSDLRSYQCPHWLIVLPLNI